MTRYRNGLVVVLLVLSGTLFAARAGVAQPLGNLLVPDSSPSTDFLSAAPDFHDGLSGRDFSIDAIGRKLDLGPVGLGLDVAPRRTPFTLDPVPDARAQGRLPSIYNSGSYTFGSVADRNLRTTDIGLDLRLRWPSAQDSALAGQIQPYALLGPALSLITPNDGVLSRSAGHDDPTMSLGMRGALGLTWQVSKDAALFGEYRVTQDRASGRSAGSERGIDMFYGFSLRF